jgi:hypothetical protein
VLGSVEKTALSVERFTSISANMGGRQNLHVHRSRRTIAWRGKAIEIVTIDALKIDSTRPAGFATFWSYYREERSFECAELESGLFAYAVWEGPGRRGQCSTVHELNAFLSRFVPETSAKCELPRQTPWCQIEPPQMANTVIVSEKIVDNRQLESLALSEFRSRSVNRPSTKISTPFCALDFGTSKSLVAIVDERNKVESAAACTARSAPGVLAGALQNASSEDPKSLSPSAPRLKM